MTALTNEALRLPPEERLKLIDDVWDSLAAEPASFPASDTELQELEKRRKRYLADPDSLIDWEELKRRVLKRGGNAH